MTYADEATAATPTVLDRARSLRRYAAGRPGGYDVQFLRCEAEEDGAALLLALALDIPGRAVQALRRPLPTWLALACLAARSRT